MILLAVPDNKRPPVLTTTFLGAINVAYNKSYTVSQTSLVE